MTNGILQRSGFMKKYTEPTFESIYFDVDSRLMGDPYPGEDESAIDNPWGDEFESETDANAGLALFF